MDKVKGQNPQKSGYNPDQTPIIPEKWNKCGITE